jgi:Fic family protein
MRDAIKSLKQRLDAVRPLNEEALQRLELFYDVELTYTSNAIEGNTLTLGETALVIEKGITIGGKPIKDHLEALDLYAATRSIRQAVSERRPVNEAFITGLHAQIVARSQPAIAGRYSNFRRRVAGSEAVFPNPAKVPSLMAEFGQRLASQAATAETAFRAHLDQVSIHPFTDGNGRTARLLMNTILLAGGYPPVAIGPTHRLAYLAGLERAQVHGDQGPYLSLMEDRLEKTLADYLAAIEERRTG